MGRDVKFTTNQFLEKKWIFGTGSVTYIFKYLANLFLLQYPASWLLMDMEWQTPETKLNYGPDRNPNAPCPISP